MTREFAYTQTFNGLSNTLTPRIQFTRVVNDLASSLATCCEFEIYPELTTNNVIHFHGYLKVFNNYRFRTKVIPHLASLGFMKLNKLDAKLTRDATLRYASKDKDEMQVILKTELPITESNFIYKQIQCLTQLHDDLEGILNFAVPATP